MAVLCQQPAHHDEVLQWFHDIEILAVESRVILKLDGIASFIIKGIEASDERKTNS